MRLEEIDDAGLCDWETLWWGYVCQWIGSRAQFRMTVAERGLKVEALEQLLGPMTYRHFLASDRYLDLVAAPARVGPRTTQRELSEVPGEG